jgi:hypothetical protein
MSTGLECQIVEHAPKRWYYVLQDWDCPFDAWDWREYATAYGPFASQDAAITHLNRNHANPGGYWVKPFVSGENSDPMLDELIASAHRR